MNRTRYTPTLPYPRPSEAVPFIYLTLAVTFNVAAYIVFKSISARSHDAVWFALFGAGLALGGVNTLFFTQALRSLKLGFAYPAFAGASIAAVMLVSTLLFAEQAKPINALGAVLVVLGIVALSR